jgi:hypothetical protein
LIAVEFLILATSLHAEQFPTAEVLAVYRLRWQIKHGAARGMERPTPVRRLR